MLTTQTSCIMLLIASLLPSVVNALDLRRWDADVTMVRQEVLAQIATRELPANDSLPTDHYMGWLLEGLKSVQREMDADTYLVMREAALTLGEELGAVKASTNSPMLCPDDGQVCQGRVDWELVEAMFNLKLDFVRNVLAIMN